MRGAILGSIILFVLPPVLALAVLTPPAAAAAVDAPTERPAHWAVIVYGVSSLVVGSCVLLDMV